ncbi:major facilitator superfamily domain-containing protein [Hypoxylon sp. NC1633]|nr:major facilitator superfamily domain-containing protein [Hypoxylon sp. NC1633]
MYFQLKWVILTAIFVFEIRSLICALAPNSTALIVGRAITGAGGAGITNGCYIIIAFIAHPNKRPAYTGVLGAVYGFASVVGPLIGGAFTTNVTWRWCFYLNLPVGACSMLVLFLFFHTPAAAAPRQATWKEKLYNMDPLGTLLIMASLCCYLLALQWGGVTKPWSSSEVIGTLVGFVVILAIFALQQIKLGETAMMIPRLVKNRQNISLLLFNFFLAGAYFNFVYYLPVYFQAIGGYSAVDSAVRNLPLIVGSSVFGIVAGVLLTVVGYFHTFLLSGAALASLGAGLLLTLDTGLDVGKYIGYQLILGVGAGLCLQVPVMVGQAYSSPADIPAVTAILLFFQTMGGTVFISAAQSIFANRLTETLDGNSVGLDPVQVTSIGATGLRDFYSGEQLVVVMDAYVVGLRDAWILGVVCAVMAFLSALLTPFRTIKQSSEKTENRSDDTTVDVEKAS